jgi:hypothetical protein
MIYQSKLSFISFVGVNKMKGLKEQMQQTLVTKWKTNMQGNKLHKFARCCLNLGLVQYYQHQQELWIYENLGPLNHGLILNV